MELIRPYRSSKLTLPGDYDFTFAICALAEADHLVHMICVTDCGLLVRIRETQSNICSHLNRKIDRPQLVLSKVYLE